MAVLQSGIPGYHILVENAKSSIRRGIDREYLPGKYEVQVVRKKDYFGYHNLYRGIRPMRNGGKDVDEEQWNLYRFYGWWEP